MRKFGAWLQILLQILIILTGSYNFFNILTIAMCLPCMIGETSHYDNNKNRSSFFRMSQAVQLAACVAFLSWSCKEMFMVEHVSKMIGIKLTMTKSECNNLIEWTIPIAVASALAFTVITGMGGIIRSKSNRLSTCIRTLVCCSCIAITAVPFLDLTPNMMHQQQTTAHLKPSTWRKIRWHSNSISHGYGLFRRMTGVGQSSPDDPIGYAGLPPSIVARPEIILEAQVDDSNEWRELNFRWKPGSVNQRPLQVAPHQPRLDWRMWFAALGSIKHNPWLVSFIDKILSGCPTVLDLLNEPDLVAGKKNITRVRANLYLMISPGECQASNKFGFGSLSISICHH